MMLKHYTVWELQFAIFVEFSFYQGLLVSFFGAVAGLLLGLLITQLQISFGFLMISSSLPYPMEITPTNTVIVFITILVLGAIASWIGSSRISFKLIANK